MHEICFFLKSFIIRDESGERLNNFGGYLGVMMGGSLSVGLSAVGICGLGRMHGRFFLCERYLSSGIYDIQTISSSYLYSNKPNGRLEVLSTTIVHPSWKIRSSSCRNLAGVLWRTACILNRLRRYQSDLIKNKGSIGQELPSLKIVYC